MVSIRGSHRGVLDVEVYKYRNTSRGKLRTDRDTELKLTHIGFTTMSLYWRLSTSAKTEQEDLLSVTPSVYGTFLKLRSLWCYDTLSSYGKVEESLSFPSFGASIILPRNDPDKNDPSCGISQHKSTYLSQKQREERHDKRHKNESQREVTLNNMCSNNLIDC